MSRGAEIGFLYDIQFHSACNGHHSSREAEICMLGSGGTIAGSELHHLYSHSTAAPSDAKAMWRTT